MPKKKQRKSNKSKLIYDFWPPVKLIIIFFAASALVSLVITFGCGKGQ